MNKKAFALLLFFVCVKGFSFNAALQKELVIIDAVHDYDLNPHTANYSSESQVLSGLYEGLFSYDPITLDPVPAIAESFRISRDKKTWTFNLRPEARFSNGNYITAEDVRRSWISLLNPSLNAPFGSLLDCVEGAAAFRLGKAAADGVEIRVKNSRTLTVKLINPAEHFSKILCHHAFSVIAPQTGVYSGAYTLQEKDKDHLLLVKNKAYYDAENVALPSIRILNSDDAQENSHKFNDGSVQWITGGIKVEAVYNKENVFIGPQFGTEFLFFAASRPPWNNPLVRNAVLAAIPWQELRGENFVAATSLILPLNLYPELSGIKEQDIELAKELLAQAAYDENSGLKLVFAIPDLDYTRREAEIIVSALAKIGISVKIETTSLTRYLNSLDTWNADMFTYTWIGDFADPLAFLELFRGDSSLRETRWSDSRFDKLLEEAALITDTKERYKKLAEAEQFLLDEGVVLPISHPVSVNAIDQDVLGGWYTNALDIHPFKYLFFTEAPPLKGFI